MSRVSVIIPTANMGRFLGDALTSIVRQDRDVEEIVIVDCGSLDRTADVVARFVEDGAPIRMVESRSRAPGVARNEGMAVAKGDYIAFLDADDLWPIGKLTRQLAHLEKFASKGMVTGFARYFDILDPVTLAPAANSRIETIFYGHLGTCLYRRAVLERIGGFEESLLYSEDVDLLMRVRDAGIDFTILRDVMLYYRRHDNSMMTQTDARKTADFRRAVAMSIARRRAGGKQPVDHNLFESYLEAAP